MKLGVHLADLSQPHGRTYGPGLADLLSRSAQAAEAGGASTVTMMDHWFQIEELGGPREPMLEGYTSLGFLAGRTTEIELGLLVTGVTYRHPGLLAKIVATLDTLSGGRAMLGVGAAWYEREHRGLGIPLPALTERFGRLEETVRICRQMWGADDGPFEGSHYHLAETICEPRPVRVPRVLIGGSGERRTLRLVAQHADACNLFAGDVAQVAHKIDVLQRHCDDVGRDFEAIAPTIIGTWDPVAEPEDFLRAMQQYAALGVQQVFTIPHGDPVAWIEKLGERVVPRLHEL